VVRLLGLVTVAMVGSLTVLLGWFAWAVRDLAAGITAHEAEADRPVAVPLPDPAHLLDPRAFAAALAQRPAELGALHAARARALAAKGDWDGALQAFAIARQQALITLPAADRIATAEALWQRARFQEAQAELLDLGLAGLGEADRAAAVELLGRCHLALRAQERLAAKDCAVGPGAR
jgi:hypothetical protein